VAADDLLAYAICTLPQANQWIFGVSETTSDDDVLVKRAINAVTDEIEKYLDRRVIVRSGWITEYFDGDGDRICYVRNPPIVSLDSIYIEDLVTLDSTDCADTDEVRFDVATGENAERGRIWLMNYTFNKGYADNCYRKYKGGWYKKDNTDGDGGAAAEPQIPRNIFMACLMEVKRIYKFRERQDSNVASKSLGVTGESISYFQDKGLSDEAKMQIDRYRRVRY
jgi:hypothetical protein